MPKTEIYEIEVVVIGDHILIKWEANVGWGEYTLTRKGDEWYADSEYMDKGDNKAFLTALLNRFVEDVIVEG